MYKYVNGKLKTRSTIPELQADDGLKTTDPEKANALNKFFASVFTNENPIIPRILQEGDISMPEIEISRDMVEAKLKKLRIDKSPGPDNLHPRVLKEIAAEISQPLAELMQNSLDRGETPSCWRDANITAIHKKGDKTVPGNYRPVSLTSQVCKAMESIIRDHILDFFTSNNLIAKSQHGFIPGRSCATQLLECLEKWTAAIDDGNPLDVIYLDFCKAFDSVPHARLLNKLFCLGVRGKAHDWCRSFLLQRRQRVMVNGSPSEWEQVKSGVPQGCVIGPIFFVVYVNDMPDVVCSTLKLFADDAKLFRMLDAEDATLVIQEDLRKLIEWTTTWQMDFNPSKCQALHLGSRNGETTYSVNGQDVVSVEKDLGVHIDKKLSFNYHTECATNKANKILGMLRRSFDYMDERTLTLLFKSLVRPHLEYCHAVAFPRTIGQMKSIEAVQRRATKSIRRLHDLPYEDRLKELKLPSMKYRLHRGDMIEIYKYTHNMYKVEPEDISIIRNETSTRGHIYKLAKPRCNTTLRQKTFPHRAIEDWNSLPETVVTAPSFNSFKGRLDKHSANTYFEF